MKLVRSKRALERAWRVIYENSRASPSETVKLDVEKFAENATANINALSSQISRGTFRFPPAKGIPIAKQRPDGSKDRTKIRPIVLAPVQSRIVQRSILDGLATVTSLQPYAENAFSFGGIRKKTDQLAAVPAAVQGVLSAIADGGQYVMFADIRAFFTKIPKSVVTDIVARSTNDSEFMDFFSEAIRTELENMAELKERAQAFPIEAIGVAQGNSLSPLLGNILLHDFDQRMNEGDCVCLRYIDDFIILAPTRAAAKARMRRAVQMLSAFEMSLSEEKSSREPISVTQKFDFLGIEFNNGFIRPSEKAIIKLENNVRERLKQSAHKMRSTKRGDLLPRGYSLAATINRIDGIVRGWGKHYQFCNDDTLFSRIDIKVQELVRQFLGEYRSIKASRDAADASMLLGIDELGRQCRSPLIWPRKHP
jgi:RNA-directed DNA polymerase